MPAFDDMFKRAAPLLFAQLAEPIVYRPLNGVPRTIDAIVVRNAPQPLGTVPEQHTPMFVITVKSDPVLGVLASDIDSGGDQVDVSERIGGDVTTRRITKINPERRGITEFEVR